MFQTVVIIGFIVVITGWCIAGFSEERILGVSIFLVGSVTAVIGIIGSHLNMDFTSEDRLKIPGLGLKIASIGFGVSSFSVLSSFFISHADIANYIFYESFVMVVIGISIMFFGIKKNKESGLGLKIASIGFGVFCLPILSGFFINHEDVANYIFYAGFVMVLIGISLIPFGIKKHKE